MSNNLQRYVLLEINKLGTKVIGIYSYTNAVSKRDEMISNLSINKYQIDGPFNVNLDEDTINPFLFPPIVKPEFPSIKPPMPTIIESPRLKNIKNPFHE